jgi:hypothetical protein
MYNKIIDIINKGAGKISPDIVFWTGAGVIGAVLLLTVIHAVWHSNHKLTYAFRKVIKLIALLYIVFAYYVISTRYALDFSNLIIYMGYPLAVIVLSYIFYCIFFGHSPYRYKVDGENPFQPDKPDTKADKIAEREIKRQEKQAKKQAKAKEKQAQAAFTFDDTADEKPKNKKSSKKQAAFGDTAEEEQSEFVFGDTGEETPENKKAETMEEVAFTFDTDDSSDESEIQPDLKSDDESEMFIVSKIKDDTADQEQPITPVSTVEDGDERVTNISRLAEQIERRRQSNIDITDGKKENKFTFETETKTEYKPKVVARQITETVPVRPVTAASGTGFTARKITETKTSERTYTGSGISASRTTASSSSLSSRTIGAASSALRTGSLSSSASRTAGAGTVGAASSASRAAPPRAGSGNDEGRRIDGRRWKSDRLFSYVK